MDEIYEIELTTFAYGGDSLGRLPDGRAAFVPFGLPGERVRIALIEEKQGFVRGRLVEILDASPQRITPRCAHFTSCGGCHYQHMPYSLQVAAKADILRDQLERIGGLPAPLVQPIIPSAQEYEYRNHIQFHLDEQGQLGYYKARSQEVLAIQECHLPVPALNELWPQLDFEALPEIERIGLRAGADDDIQIILESNSPEAPEILVEGLSLSVIHLSPAGELVLAGSPEIIMQVSGRNFHLSGASFFQANSSIAEAMVAHVIKLLEYEEALAPSSVGLEVYCGVGLFSAFLAPQVGQLVGIEASASACADFSLNLDEFDNVTLYEAPAEIVVNSLDLRPDFILVDPPRQGIDRKTLDGLLKLAPPCLVYVSCDAATLARDARRLSTGGYHLKQVALFDQFPQTYHIESISLWKKS